MSAQAVAFAAPGDAELAPNPDQLILISGRRPRGFKP